MASQETTCRTATQRRDRKIKEVKLLKHYRGHKNIDDLAFMYDGTILFICEDEKTLHRISTTGEDKGQPFPLFLSDPRCIATNNTTHTIAVTDKKQDGSTVKIWHMKDGHWRPKSFSSERGAFNLDLLNDKGIVCINMSDEMFMYDKDGQEQWCITLTGSEHNQLVCNQGEYIVVLELDKQVTVFDQSGKVLHKTPKGFLKEPRAICADSEGHMIVADFDTRTLSQFSLAGDFIQKVVVCDGYASTISMFNDKYLAVGTFSQGIYIYSLEWA